MIRTAPRYRALARVLVGISLAAASAVVPAAQPATRAAPWQSTVPWVPNGGGGPDAFGYVWADDTSPPVFEWIDISTTGTLVTGLADDNSAPAISLPFTFKFYWTDINSFRVGSNGWIGLGNNPPNNIASCFPAIPTAGGPGDSYVAPLMGDLNFTGAGNPGSVRYLIDQPNQRLIVSYLNVPYWSVTAPGWVGSNTFQVILDGLSRTIKFQYLALSGFVGNASCIDLVGGIEAPQGQIGLQLFSDAQPPGNRAIVFAYPNPPLIQIIDPTPSALVNSGSAGAFVLASAPLALTANVSNDGDGATTSAVNVRGQVFNSAGTSLYDQTVPVPSLAGGASVPVTFPSPPTVPPGHYRFRVDVTGGGDINPGNNVRESEIVALPAGATTFDYIGTDTAGASLDWNGAFDGTDGTGLGILIVPPGPGYIVNSLGFQLSSNTAGTVSKLKLVDNDGPNGTPLTVLGESLTPTSPNNAWIDVPITPVALDADGAYILWIDRGNAFINLSTTVPISRRSIEFFAGGYGTWRSNEIQEPFLRATVVTDAIFKDGFE